MWILLAVVSALCLGAYDIFKKISVDGNNVPVVLFYNTLFSALLMSPVLVIGIAGDGLILGGGVTGHVHILIKSFIVLSSWLLGYFGLKHLPLTIAGPINAARPVIVLVGALLIFGETLNWLQWVGILLGFWSLFFISRLGSREGFSFKHSKWLWFSIGATFMGAVSALYDKWLLKLYEPLQVQAWYSFYQLIIMGITLLLVIRMTPGKTRFRWSWAIPFISVFLTIADIAYFYSLSIDGSMIAVVSMIRRGSVIVSFIYGVFALHEKNIKLKLIDLSVLLLGLLFLVLGSR